MSSTLRRIALAVAVVLSISVVAAGVYAATQSDDEAALAPARPPASKSIEQKVDSLLGQMTTHEKLEQVQLLADWQAVANNDQAAKDGVGGVFSLTDPVAINRLQHEAVEQTRLHIPILFAYDTIHGYRTTFPIPLGAASSFDPGVVAADDTVAARETAQVGIKQIYSPMVDVSHEPRWGRIAEGGGEDPYLGSVMAAARVKAAQGTDYSQPNKVVTSVKHFAAYGQPEGGREYGVTDMSESRLRNLYLPPFKAAIDAGADTVMCSFNAISGVPGCANHETETDILKKEWGFDGFIESDYTAVAELRSCPQPDNGPCGHGIAADGPAAAAAAFNAGTDSEMVSTFMRDSGADLLASGQVSMSRLNDAVRRILRVKFRAGLFDHPYVDVAAAQDESNFVTAADREKARTAAERSMVLLKNDNATLPFSPDKSTAVIGPLGDNQDDMLGPWAGVGKTADVVSLLTGMKNHSNQPVTYAQGCELSHVDEVNQASQDPEGCNSTAGFQDAVDKAAAADQVVIAVGESRQMSGESESRSNIDLPGKQEDLIRAIVATGKPVAVVLFNGRPLALENVIGDAPAWLEAWFPGVEAGNAVAKVVFGDVNPGGKLPVSFPQGVGQVPIYYNHEPTGRPCSTTFKWNNRYRDLFTCDPLFPFGFGLSYTTFKVDNVQISKQSVSKNGSLTVSMDVTNTGDKAGDDVAQLYIHDPVASISQPVRRLRGFQRVTLAKGAHTTVTFTLDKSDFGFYDNRGKFIVEPGTIDVFAGDSSTAPMAGSFTVTG